MSILASNRFVIRSLVSLFFFFFFQAEDGIRDKLVTGVQTCALPIYLAAYRDAVPEWSVLVGSASLFYAALEMGCDGGVLAAACFAGRLCADLQAAYRAGDRARAGRLQERLAPLDKEIVGKLGPAGVKAAMDAVGLYGGPCRAPLAPVPRAVRERVAQLVAA